MADGTPAPKAGAKPGAKKKIPTWYYIAGVGGLAIVYYLWQKSRAASAAAAGATTTTPAASATAPVAAGSYSSPYSPGQYLQGQSAAASSSTGSAAFALPSGENYIGSGYGFSPSAQVGASQNPINVPQTPATSISGATYTEVPQNQLGPLTSGGQQVYYQPSPGVFIPLPPGAVSGNLQGLVGTTPLFILQQSASPASVSS